MPDVTTQTMPYNPSPQDNFLLVGSNDSNFGLFTSRIIDVLSSANLSTNWFFPDGTGVDENGRISSIPNANYYVSQDTIPFEFVLTANRPGDTFVLYSEQSNIFVRDGNLNIVTDVIPRSILYLLWNGQAWINFSEQAASGGGLFVNKGVVTSSGFAGVGQGSLVNLVIDKSITINNSFIYYPPGLEVDGQIVRVNIQARPKPLQRQGVYLDIAPFRGVVLNNPRQQSIEGIEVDLPINRGIE